MGAFEGEIFELKRIKGKWYCVAQLMLYTGDKLSSPIF